jgi:hypothetical protein
MTNPDIHLLLSHTHLARFATDASARDQLYQRARRGELMRVFTGCYVDTAYWRSLASDDRHRALAHLCALRFGDDLVFSHRTAAALWRLPVLGAWPDRAHVADRPARGRPRTAALARHSLGIEGAPPRIDGLRVTPLAVTVAQLAASEHFACGVVAADAALRTLEITPDELLVAAGDVPRNHGNVRARTVALFADALSDSPGESASRANMHLAGLRRPQLQVELFGASGKRYFVGFWWPELRHIGEFDGKAKYRDPEFLQGRTPEQALADEKEREDDLRAARHSFSRWGWNTALSPTRLAALLLRAGVPRVSPPVLTTQRAFVGRARQY